MHSSSNGMYAGADRMYQSKHSMKDCYPTCHFKLYIRFKKETSSLYIWMHLWVDANSVGKQLFSLFSVPFVGSIFVVNTNFPK